MAHTVDYLRKKFGPLRDKTLENALAGCIGREFPRIGGPRIRRLCAEMILEEVGRHLRPRDHVRHGQVLWLAVSRDARPRRHQRIAETELVAVVLELSTREDVQARIDRVGWRQVLQGKAVRLCRQAYEQGGLLSNCDLAELLGTHDSRIAEVLGAYERQAGKVVPRRATVHDVGTSLTHKGIICHKRYAEGKDVVQIARETYHSTESVDRYLGQYDRVRHCRVEGLTATQTAHALGCSVWLVEEYLRIDEELERRDGCGARETDDNGRRPPRG